MTATASGSVPSYDWISIYRDDTAELVASCAATSTCAATVNDPTSGTVSYTGYISDVQPQQSTIPGGLSVASNTVTLTAPLVTGPGGGVNAGWAGAPLGPVAARIAKTGISPLDVCEDASEVPGATHFQHLTTSDQTDACVTAIALPGSNAVKIARGLTAMRATVAGAGVAVVAGVVLLILHTTSPHPAPGPRPHPEPGPHPTPPPGPSPGPTPGETEIDLVTQRITATMPDLDPALARTAARTCVDEEKAAGDTTKPCLTMPLFFPGLDAQQAAAHDAQVIANVPAWFRLTYMSPTDKEASVKRNWYTVAPYTKQCPSKPSLRDAQCDEYPFYSTVEGGPTAYAITTSVLEEVSASDNRREGRALQDMQYDPSCKMAKSAGKATDFPGSGAQQFLVIPMVLPVSSHLCSESAAG